MFEYHYHLVKYRSNCWKLCVETIWTRIILSVPLFIHREISEVRFPFKRHIILKVPLSVYKNLEVLLDIGVWCASLMGHGLPNAKLKFNLVTALPTESENNAPCVGSGVVSNNRRKLRSSKWRCVWRHIRVEQWNIFIRCDLHDTCI